VKESKYKEDWTKEIRMQHLNKRHKKKQKSLRLKIKRSPKESAKKSNNGARHACTSLRRTGLSGVHRTVFGAQASAPNELAALGKTKSSTAKIHRTVRCIPDCPVSPRPTVIFANGRLLRGQKGQKVRSG
jgi:hypothetical protein